MRHITATDAACRFAELLERVEREGESYTIMRNGRPVARLKPASGSTGRVLFDVLDAHPVDDEWRREVAELRAGIG